MLFALNVLAAGALGAFLALLIALSTSPVVAPTVASLLAAALLFLALTDKLPVGHQAPLSSEVLARILSFSVFAAIALVVGLYVRTTSIERSRSIVGIYEEIKGIGFSETEARVLSLDIYKTQQATLTEHERAAGTTVLFGRETNNAICDELEPSKFADVTGLATKFEFYGGSWSGAISYSKQYRLDKSPSEYMAFLTGFYTAMCRRDEAVSIP